LNYYQTVPLLQKRRAFRRMSAFYVDSPIAQFWLNCVVFIVFMIIFVIAVFELLLVRKRLSASGKVYLMMLVPFAITRALSFGGPAVLVYYTSTPVLAVSIVFDIVASVLYYVIFVYILFSWAEVAFVLQGVGDAEQKIKRRRTLTCIAAFFWILVFNIMAYIADRDGEVNVFEIVLSLMWGVIPVPLSIGILIFWKKIYRLVKERSMQNESLAGKLSLLCAVYVICLDVKTIYYILAAIVTKNIISTGSSLPNYYLNVPSELVATSVLMYVIHPYRKSKGLSVNIKTSETETT